MNVWKRVAVASASVLAASFALSACGGPSKNDDSGEFQKVTIAVTNNLVGVPVFVASEKGLFAERGLDVSLKVVASGNDAARALQAGDVDFALASTVSILAIRSGGVNATMLAMTSGDATNASYDLGNGIVANGAKGVVDGDPESLRGKTIATNVGGSPHQYLLRYLEANGMSESDVEILNTPVPETVPALEQGLVDAIATVEPQLTSAQLALGDDAILLSQNEGYTSAAVGLIGMADKLEGNSDVIEKVVSAVAEASQMSRLDPDTAVNSALSFVEGLDTEVAQKSFVKAITDPRISVCTFETLTKGAKDAVASGQVTTEILAEDVFDSTWIDGVVADEPEYFDDLEAAPTVVGDCQ